MQQIPTLNVSTAAPMDVTPNEIFGMGAQFPADASALANSNFADAVSQVMAGLDTSQSAGSSSSPSHSQPPVPTVASAPKPTGGPGLPVIPPVPSHGPMSRRRGLSYAQHVKAYAREEFKDKRRRELEAMGEGERTKRRKKNDTSMTERQKYRRRLQKNQDSAAAARFANDAYLNNLETQVDRYDADMNCMATTLRRVEAERDEYARLNEVFMDHTKRLEAELQALREERAKRVSQSSDKQPAAAVEEAVDNLTAAWNLGNASSHIQQQPVPTEYKAMLEAYSAATYNLPTELPDISVGDVVGTKLPAAF